MNERPVAALISELEPDPFRREVGFSPEVTRANDALLGSGATRTEAIKILNDWLQKHQPCLFGRIAAKAGLISYCILSENDLKGSDDGIRNKIQEARTAWTREGFEGRKSGFVILVVSPIITLALPNKQMEALARRLCSLYLLDEIETDEIYLDELFLEIPGSQRATWRWHAGVNYFCAQADKRWWQDHRVPGGMAFSVNSVGHMTKSGRLASAMKDLNAVLEVPSEPSLEHKIESLPTALEFAMRTIAIASDAVSGRATELMPLPAYFVPNVRRHDSVKPHQLDFTYLFVNELENPAFTTMGSGRRIRRASLSPPLKQRGRGNTERSKMIGKELPIDECERLVRALAPSRRAKR